MTITKPHTSLECKTEATLSNKSVNSTKPYTSVECKTVTRVPDMGVTIAKPQLNVECRTEAVVPDMSENTDQNLTLPHPEITQPTISAPKPNKNHQVTKLNPPKPTEKPTKRLTKKPKTQEKLLPKISKFFKPIDRKQQNSQKVPAEIQPSQSVAKSCEGKPSKSTQLDDMIDDNLLSVRSNPVQAIVVQSTSSKVED